MEQNTVERVKSVVEGLKGDLKELTMNIYNNPEIGLTETKACKWQKELLEKYGFEVETPYAGFDTAYRAVYKGKKTGPKIAMLAEYDALPGLGHGCGHNLIAMVGVGAGIAMREFADEYGGEIYVFGTPAEENLGGKVQMSEQGAFDDMDVAMMAHPAGVNLDCSNTMAINAYQISFYGKTAHAAGAPHEGINALDAMINLFNLINAMRQETTPDTRIHGIIKKGGEAPNIIPDYTESLFYVRTNRYADLLKVCDRVEACAKGAALATGCRYTMEFAEGNYKDTCSNLTLAELNAQQMEKLGVPMKRTKGKYIPGSSDLGDVSYHCPSIQSSFDITGGRKYNAHTVEFAECAGSEEGIEASFAVIEGFVMTAIELMTDPSHLEAIKDEFNKMQKN